MANVLPALAPQDRPLALVHGLRVRFPQHPGPPAPLRTPSTARDHPARTSGRRGTAVSSIPATATRRNEPWRPRPLRGPRPSRDRTDGRRHHRPRLRRRGPHDRLHQQGLRGARPPRLGPGREQCCPRSPNRPLRRGAPKRQGSGGTPTISPASSRPSSHRPATTGRQRESRAGPNPLAVSFDDKATRRSPGTCSATTRPRSSPPWTTPQSRGPAPNSWPVPLPTRPRSASTRFHTQNDHGDWDVVHHGFTTANATHQLINRLRHPELLRGVYQAAMKVFLDRFLNVPPARLPGRTAPTGRRPDLDSLQACWDQEGMVDEAGAIVYGWLRSGGDRVGRPWPRSGSAPARGGRRVPLVPDLRGRRPPVRGLAAGIGASRR